MKAVFDLSRTGARELRLLSIFGLAYCGAFAITLFHQEIFVYVRYLLMAALPISLLIPLDAQSRAAQRHQNAPFAFTYFFFIVYGIALSFIWGGSIFFSEDVNRAISLALSIVYAIILFDVFSTCLENEQKWDKGIPGLSIFLCASTIFVLISGGISLSPLALNLQTVDGADLNYSQGFTKVTAIAGVYFLVIATNVKRSLSLYGLAIAFLGLSVLAGSRGDILAGLFALLLFLIRRPNAVSVTMVAGAALFLFVFIIQSGIWSEFTVFNRFLQLTEGNYSMRDLLFSDALSLIGSHSCSAFGCGFNYFQIWSNYAFGLYPHNVFLESLITFGLLLGGIASILSVYGAVYLYVRMGRNPLLYICLVDFFSLQKSSSLIDFTSLSTLLCFAWLGGQAMIRGSGAKKPVPNANRRAHTQPSTQAFPDEH